MRERGIAAASFSRNSDGSKQIALVPSRHVRRRRSSTLSSGVNSTASWATAGRRTCSRCRAHRRGTPNLLTQNARSWIRGRRVLQNGVMSKLEDLQPNAAAKRWIEVAEEARVWAFDSDGVPRVG